MIIPSIDLQGGQSVQLIGGKELAIEAGDPFKLAREFSRIGEIAVIDLDAAMGKGHHRPMISELCRQFPCRVGGGIRDLDTALYWLNQGARKIIIGTAAHPNLLSKLPKDRVMVALDSNEGEVVIEGWTKKTGQSVEKRIKELAPYVSGFLITFVEREGRLQGTDLDRIPSLLKAAQGTRLTIAGGVNSAVEIAKLDRMGADAQVGMALYKGEISLAEAFTAPVKSDRPDGLWPTVIVDEYDRSLGLAYSNLLSVEEALNNGQGIYWSRKRGLWKKGESSGATQELLSISLDCDRDTLRFKVRQKGKGFCHLDTRSCWGDLQGLPSLESRINQRLTNAEPQSYTRRLISENDLLSAKLREECDEFIAAQSQSDIIAEAADLFYFMSVKLADHGVAWSDVASKLDLRALKVTRRKGDAKAQYLPLSNSSRNA